jgi:hypothetical protein
MVNGWCFGGGYGPLFGCDLAFAAEEAQFGLSEINWGILPGGGATKVVVDLLSMRDAMYHAMMGEHRRQESRRVEAGQRGRAAGAPEGAGHRGGQGAAQEEPGGAEGHQGRRPPGQAR